MLPPKRQVRSSCEQHFQIINVSVLTSEVSPRNKAIATCTNSVGILWMKHFVVSEISNYVTKMPDTPSFLAKV